MLVLVGVLVSLARIVDGCGLDFDDFGCDSSSFIDSDSSDIG